MAEKKDFQAITERARRNLAGEPFVDPWRRATPSELRAYCEYKKPVLEQLIADEKWTTAHGTQSGIIYVLHERRNRGEDVTAELEAAHLRLKDIAFQSGGILDRPASAAVTASTVAAAPVGPARAPARVTQPPRPAVPPPNAPLPPS